MSTAIILPFFSCLPSGLFRTKSSQVPTTGRDEKGRSNSKRILSVWTSSWRRPSSTAAPRGPPPAGAQRTTTMTRSAGRSESGRAQSPRRAAASVLEDGEKVGTLSAVDRCFNILKSLSGKICQNDCFLWVWERVNDVKDALFFSFLFTLLYSED